MERLGASWDDYSSLVLNNSEVIDKVGQVVPDVHNLFPIGSTSPPKFWSAAEVAAAVHSSGPSLEQQKLLSSFSIVLFYTTGIISFWNT